MALTEERREYIAALANDEWVTGNMDDAELEQQQLAWDKRLHEFLNSNSNPEELHVFVSLYNWDKGIENLTKIADSASCDLNTARLIFWATAPDWHQEKYSNRDEAEAGRNGEEWDLLQLIIQNVESGKYKKEEMPTDYTSHGTRPVNDPKWTIPTKLYGGK